MNELKYMLNSREMFKDFQEQCYTKGMTDIQRAARFFMLVKTSYGSTRTSFGCTKRNIEVAKIYLEKIHKRLDLVIIENNDFEKLIKAYDRPEALFYLDPPYYSAERYYQIKFSQDDHVRLCEVLKELKGKFILTYNDCDFVRGLYNSSSIKEISRNNNLNSRYNDNKKYYELIIKNF